MISIKDAGFKTVGVIKITPTKKPHYVARAIERLNKDDSFVRRGSTTSALSHHDLAIILDNSGKLKSESKEYSNAGEKHFSLGNYLTAIKAFSKAIELMPEPELFFRRALAYQNHLEDRVKNNVPPTFEDELKELQRLRNKDFNDAIALSESSEFELKVRKVRYFSIYNFERTESLGYTNDQAYEDFVVIKESLPENEKAEWVIYQIDETLIKWDERALSELEDLLNSGYQTSRLYRLLIELHSEAMFNYGIALKLVNEALEKFKDDESSIHRFLSEKINLLLQTKKYDEAVNVINKLKRMGKSPSIDLDTNDLLIRIALRHGMEYRNIPTEPIFATFLMLYFSRQRPPGFYEKIDTKNSIFQYSENQLARLDNEIPGLLENLEELVGEDIFWAVINNDQDFSWSVIFRSIGQ